MLAKKLKKTKETEEIIGDVQKKPRENLDHLTSHFFSAAAESKIWEKVYQVELDLTKVLNELFSKVTTQVSVVYNPIEYAKEVHIEFLKRYFNGKKQVLYVGMNPGPYGMCQTGIPFGDVKSISEWLKISGPVSRPAIEHPKHTVVGFELKRDEASGKRFWGVLRELFGTPDVFFSFSGIYNLCPQGFFDKSGRNITPADLPNDVQNQLIVICNKYLAKIIEIIEPEIVVPIGRFVEKCLNRVIIDSQITKICMKHPSPRAVNNQNWVENTKKWFRDNPILMNSNENVTDSGINLLDEGGDCGGPSGPISQ